MEIKLYAKYLLELLEQKKDKLSADAIRKLDDMTMFNSHRPERVLEFSIMAWYSEDLIVLRDHIKPSLQEDTSINGALQTISILLKARSNPSKAKTGKLADFHNIVAQYLSTETIDFMVLLKRDESQPPLPWLFTGGDYSPPSKYSPAESTLYFKSIKNWRTQETSITYRDSEIKGKFIHEALSNRGIMTVDEDYHNQYCSDKLLYKETIAKDGIQYLCDGYGYVVDNNSYGLRGSSSRMLMTTDGVKHKLITDDGSIKERESMAKFEILPQMLSQFRDDLLPIPYHLYVMMFDLTKHLQVNVHVRELRKYEYDTSIIDKLILPSDHKSLIETLSLGTDQLAEDVVENKKGGIICLLSGNPGLGKTLSAEVFGEYLQKPLYIVQSSQLGTSPKGLEESLDKVLSRANRWGAILLIDEADVYVRKRGTDINQNAVVGVFLRTLEYFGGVMFLTTNLAKEVDDAIVSRMTAHLQFDMPIADARREIWKIMLNQWNMKYDPNDLEEVVENIELSGRMIKNLVKLLNFIIGMDTNPYNKFDLEAVKYAIKFSPANESEYRFLNKAAETEAVDH